MAQAKKYARPVIQIVVNPGESQRWRAASETDPALAVLPENRRLSAFVRLAVEARIAQLKERTGDVPARSRSRRAPLRGSVQSRDWHKSGEVQLLLDVSRQCLGAMRISGTGPVFEWSWKGQQRVAVYPKAALYAFIRERRPHRAAVLGLGTVADPREPAFDDLLAPTAGQRVKGA